MAAAECAGRRAQGAGHAGCTELHCPPSSPPECCSMVSRQHCSAPSAVLLLLPAQATLQYHVPTHSVPTQYPCSTITVPTCWKLSMMPCSLYTLYSRGICAARTARRAGGTSACGHGAASRVPMQSSCCQAVNQYQMDMRVKPRAARPPCASQAAAAAAAAESSKAVRPGQAGLSKGQAAGAHLDEPDVVVRVEPVLHHPGRQRVPLHRLAPVHADAVLCAHRGRQREYSSDTSIP